MRKVINQAFETIKVRHSRDEASSDSPTRAEVLKVHPSARIQVLGTAKRVIRDRGPQDLPGLVPYIYLSGACLTQDEAWKEAAEKL